MGPAIGSISSLPGGRGPGVVVGVQTLGSPKDGRQLAALQLRLPAEGGEDGRAGRNGGPSLAADRPQTGAAPANVDGQAAAGARPRESGVGRLAEELTPAEKAEVTRLQQRDQQVRQEEKIHAAIAGDLGSAISYVFQRGPDGRQYAVGGSVGIHAVTRSGNPAEQKQIAGRLAAAAVAPTNPSAQDYATARRAYGMLAEESADGEATARRPGKSLDIAG